MSCGWFEGLDWIIGIEFVVREDNECLLIFLLVSSCIFFFLLDNLGEDFVSLCDFVNFFVG